MQTPPPAVGSVIGPVDPRPVILISPEGIAYTAGGSASIGDPEDAAWNGTDANPSLIAIMKGCYAQLALIAQNTGA